MKAQAATKTPASAKAPAPEKRPMEVGSNLAAMGQMELGEDQSDTPLLDEEELQGGPDRLSGPAADVFRKLLGEPPWATSDAWSFHDDRLKIVNYAHMDGDQMPDWYSLDARNLGHADGNTGGLGAFGLDMGGGVYFCGAWSAGRESGDYFMVEYVPAVEKKGIADHLSGPALGAYYMQHSAVAVLNFVLPHDNLMQALAARNLDAHSEDFGERLSGGDITAEVLEAISEVAMVLPALRAGKALTFAEKVSVAVTVGTAVGEAAIETLLANNIIDERSAHYSQAVLKLINLYPSYCSYSEGALGLSDYLSTMAALWGAGTETIKGVLGEDGHDKFWLQHNSLFAEVLDDGSNFATIIELMVQAGKGSP